MDTTPITYADAFIFYLFCSCAKRKHSIISRIGDASLLNQSTASTGLTQEIDIMDIGSSTPKKRKTKSPIKGVLKIR